MTLTSMVSFLLACAAMTVAVAASGDAPQPGIPWPATDALGRKLPLSKEVGAPRQDRWVGIFYFLWHDNPGGKSPHWDAPYDIARILQADPDALKKPESPYWGPIGMYHYWGEPMYGYYLSTDEWVLRRHAQLLADAGVDTLIFDTTNAATYKPVNMKLCEVFTQVRREGGRTPQIAFMVNTEGGKTARTIYEDLYKPGLYKDLWFTWKGKPLIICDPAMANAELKSFFTLRRAHWPFEMVNTHDAWHWEAAYPQPYGYSDDPAVAEQVNVSVAQNLRRADGKVTNMSNGDARGRSFANGRVDTSPGAVNWGRNAEEQWKRVFELNPPFVMVTGWNEWIAGRWGDPKGPLVFVDQFDEENSRDIEPSRVGHTDSYYWQMIANIRKYKGAAPLPRPTAPKAIRAGGPFAQWKEVGPSFLDHVGDTVRRESAGAAGLHYRNETGRNDLVEMKVARSRATVAFYARTAGPVSPSTDPNWMWLLIDAAPGAGHGWEGYQYIVNRTMAAPGKTWLERSQGGWNWEKVAQVEYRVEGNELQVVIPRRLLGLAPNSAALAIDFKWIDNCQEPGNPLDVYVSGDAAPEGRFRFRYQTAR